MVTDLHDPPPGTLDVAALPGPHLRRERSQTTAHGGLHAERIPGVRRLPTLASRVQPDVALFQSWHGRYSDSPRAVAEELRRRGAPLEQVWVIADGCPAPDGAAIVRPGTLDYLRQLGRARYVVTNTTLPGYYRKKRSTTYLQTWHGTPLKRIALDLEQPRFAGGAKYLRDLRREAATWDYLVSPNAFSTPIFRRAFEYGGDVLETGYPRNDLLLSEEREALRARVRDELGLDADAVAVLYAPTWRDDDAAFAAELDLAAMAEALGPRHSILMRAHHLEAASVAVADHPAIADVSAISDVTELLLAADVLITDYSSVMFDFAVTGKPMLFFTYDLDRYRDELRGFYFDFAGEAPGPLLATTQEVIAALRDLDGVRRGHAAAYGRFRDRFCHLEDGHAAARVVDAVFG